MRALALIGRRGRSGRIGNWSNHKLMRELRRAQEAERRAHSIGDDELAAKLAKRARELKRRGQS